jgi:membrane associated rhomboid family serine protease
VQLILNGVKSRAAMLALYVGSIWAVSFAGFALPGVQHFLGVTPRSVHGLLGLFTAPWVHANFGHLMANTVPLIVLGWLSMFPRQEGFWQAVVGGTLGAGIAAWLLGGPYSVHIGASGVVFGLFGFILARGYFARRPVDILISLAAAMIYGISMLWSLLPVYPGVSWQSHVGGAIGGVLTAWLVCRDR